MTVFIDASFLIALFNKDDQFHKKAKRISQQLRAEKIRLVTSNIVLAETINVIFRLQGPIQAKKFYSVFKKIKIEEFFISRKVFTKAYSLLWQQRKKGLNFFDCLHLATMRHWQIKTLATFDQEFTRQKIELFSI